VILFAFILHAMHLDYTWTTLLSIKKIARTLTALWPPTRLRLSLFIAHHA